MATTLDAQLEKDLERLAKDETFADAVLKGSDGQVAMHQAILNVRSPKLMSEPSEPENHMGTAGGEKVTFKMKEDVKTLTNFVFFLYTDKVKDGLTCTEAMSLMVLARRLCEGQTDEDLPERRLYVLCEKSVCQKLGPSTATEVLKCALSHDFPVLEQSVYKLLARKKVVHIAFARRLVEEMVPDHTAALPYAIAAMCGNENPRNMNAAAMKANEPAGKVPPSRLLKDLQTLLDQAKNTTWPGSQQPFVDCGIAVEGEASGFGAHRCMLALRSEYYTAALRSHMQEGVSGLVHLSIQPPPSKKALEALLSFIYTGAWEVDGGEHVHYLDLLSILGDDYLKLSGHKALNSAVVKHVLRHSKTDDPWQLLRKAIKLKNDDLRCGAKEQVLLECFQRSGDLEALAASCGPSDECSSRWTDEDEATMMKELLWSTLDLSLNSVKGCNATNWTLQVQVENALPEGTDGVFNSAGNVYLNQRTTDTGSATLSSRFAFGDDEGWIQATFAETVYVKSVVVAPLLPTFGPEWLKRAVLQVKTATGDWDTICENLTGQEQTIAVQRIGREWRLYGLQIATSMFIFEP